MIMGSAAVIAANNQRKAEEQSRKIHKAKIWFVKILY